MLISAGSGFFNLPHGRCGISVQAKALIGCPYLHIDPTAYMAPFWKKMVALDVTLTYLKVSIEDPLLLGWVRD